MLAFLPILATVLLTAPVGPVQWHFGARSQGNGLVTIDIRTEVEAGWHIYATTLPSDDGPIATSIRFTPSDAYALHGPLKEAEPVEVYDPNFGMVVRYHDGSPAFEQVIKPTKPGAFEVEGEVEYMVCNDRTCLPPVLVPFKLRIETM